jgi:hypothetical protein
MIPTRAAGPSIFREWPRCGCTSRPPRSSRTRRPARSLPRRAPPGPRCARRGGPDRQPPRGAERVAAGVRIARRGVMPSAANAAQPPRDQPSQRHSSAPCPAADCSAAGRCRALVDHPSSRPSRFRPKRPPEGLGCRSAKPASRSARCSAGRRARGVEQDRRAVRHSGVEVGAAGASALAELVLHVPAPVTHSCPESGRRPPAAAPGSPGCRALAAGCSRHRSRSSRRP